MYTEGKGRIAPRPVAVRLTRQEANIAKLEAERRVGYRNYARGNTAWKRGLLGNRDFREAGRCSTAVAPVFVGIVTEYAVCNFINTRLSGANARTDTDLHLEGDGGRDIVVFDQRIQVKGKTNIRGDNLIRRVTQSKRLVPLECDYVVFTCYSGGLTVNLLGWIRSRSVIEEKFLKSHRAEHWNIQVDDRNLEPMGELILELESKRECLR